MSDQILPAIPLVDRYPYPCLRITRGFRIAADIRKLFLGGLALLVLAAGNLALGLLPFVQDDARRDGTDRTAIDAMLDGWLGAGETPATILGSLLDPTPQKIGALALHWSVLLLPLRTVLDPAAALFTPGATWSQAAWAMTRLLWALSVWSVFGGALTRMAAVQFAKDEKISVWTALRFSLGKFISLLSAPVLPLAGVAVLAGLCALGGALGRIPSAGPPLVAVTWALALALGFVMALMLLATAAGWPLMCAAVSTEGSDAYDGFSRAYSFLFSRPWHCAGYALFALAYGSLGLVFLSVVATLVVHLAAWGVGLGLGSETVNQLHLTAPASVAGTLDAASTSAPTTATHIVGGWLFVLSTLLGGYIASYFWTASTILYFLLRHVDDASNFDEVWIAEGEEVDDLLPLAGVAASEQRPIIERPVRPPTVERAAGATPSPAATVPMSPSSTAAGPATGPTSSSVGASPTG